MNFVHIDKIDLRSFRRDQSHFSETFPLLRASSARQQQKGKTGCVPKYTEFNVNPNYTPTMQNN